MNVRINWTGALAALAVFSFGSVAAAQDWESGDTGAWGSPPPDDQQQQQQEQPPAEQQPPAQQQQWQQQPQQQGWQQEQQQQQTQQQEQPPGWGETEAPPTGDGDDGPTDHELVVGHMGVGFFGVQGVNLTADDGSGQPFTIDAPTIGIRYWLGDSIGLDVGLGFGFVNLGGEVDSPDALVSADILEGFALTVHGGLPLALYWGDHYTFTIVPELNVGFGSGTLFGGTPNDDQEFSAFFVEVGARAAAEVQLGFIGIPDLSLQGSVGLSLAFESQSREFNFGDMRGSTIETTERFRLGTTVQNEPWDLFTASIAAIYYFR